MSDRFSLNDVSCWTLILPLVTLVLLLIGLVYAQQQNLLAGGLP